MTGLQAAILGGSALILLVLALRLGLQRHLPRKLFPALWCAAAVRLLLPVSIPTCLSIWNLFERTSASAAAGTISRTLLPFPDLTDGVAMASALLLRRAFPRFLSSGWQERCCWPHM